MTVQRLPRLPRHLLVGVTSAALLGGAVGFVPLLGSASAAACPSWTDPAGDSGLFNGADPSGKSADDDLDVVSSTAVVTADGGLRVSVKVVKLSDTGPANGPGDTFVVKATVGGTATSVSMNRDTFFIGTESANLSAAAVVKGSVKFDVAASTITSTFTPAQVKTGFGKALLGLKWEAFSTTSYQYTEPPLAGSPLEGTAVDQGGVGYPVWDISTAPTTLTYTDAGGCGGTGGTPGPTGSPSPSPTPTGSPSPTPAPGGGATLFDQPRKGCVSFTDPTGDAAPTPQGNDDDLDLTAVNLKTLPDALQVYAKVAALGTAPSSTNGVILNAHRFSASVTIGGKVIVATADVDGPATVTVGGTANTDLKATAKFDTKNSNVVFTFPNAGLAKAVGSAVVNGTAVTATTVTSTAVQKQSGQTRAADSATGTKPEEKTYAYGDNTCFLPPAGKLSIDADPSGQFTDTTELFATLTDADDVAVEGATVTASFPGGKSVSAVTAADGVADLVLPIDVPAGEKPLTVTFAGTDVVGATSATSAFTVAAEKTVLKAIATKGGASATVLDDDKTPVVGQPVTFTVGSKKTVVKTNAKGVAVLIKVAKGATIKVAYAGSAGYFLATPGASVKAG